MELTEQVDPKTDLNWTGVNEVMRDIQANPSDSIPLRSRDGEAVRECLRWVWRSLIVLSKGPIHSFQVRLGYGKYRVYFCFEYISHPPSTILCSFVKILLNFQIDFLFVY